MWKREHSLRVALLSRIDAVMALTALGYSSTESLKAVSKVTITEDMDVEDVLKAALKFLL